MTTDYGSLDLKITKERDRDGNPIAVRKDGARIALKLIDMKHGHDRHAVNQSSTFADKMLQWKWIGRTQFDAACRFREDYDQSGMRERVGANYSPAAAGGTDEPTPEQERFIAAYKAAVRAMGPIYGSATSAAILHDLAPHHTDFWRVRDGLNRLIKHYGLRVDF